MIYDTKNEQMVDQPGTISDSVTETETWYRAMIAVIFSRLFSLYILNHGPEVQSREKGI